MDKDLVGCFVLTRPNYPEDKTIEHEGEVIGVTPGGKYRVLVYGPYDAVEGNTVLMTEKQLETALVFDVDSEWGDYADRYWKAYNALIEFGREDLAKQL